MQVGVTLDEWRERGSGRRKVCQGVCRVKVNFRKLCVVDNLCKNLKIF